MGTASLKIEKAPRNHEAGKKRNCHSIFPSSPGCFMCWTWTELIFFVPSFCGKKTFLPINSILFPKISQWRIFHFGKCVYRWERNAAILTPAPSSQWVSLNFTTWHMLGVKIPMADLFVICWQNLTTNFMIMTSIKHHLHPAEICFECFSPHFLSRGKNSITKFSCYCISS